MNGIQNSKKVLYNSGDSCIISDRENEVVPQQWGNSVLFCFPSHYTYNKKHIKRQETDW